MCVCMQGSDAFVDHSDYLLYSQRCQMVLWNNASKNSFWFSKETPNNIPKFFIVVKSVLYKIWCRMLLNEILHPIYLHYKDTRTLCHSYTHTFVCVGFIRGFSWYYDKYCLSVVSMCFRAGRAPCNPPWASPRDELRGAFTHLHSP